jgi:hypothetical protein
VFPAVGQIVLGVNTPASPQITDQWLVSYAQASGISRLDGHGIVGFAADSL